MDILPQDNTPRKQCSGPCGRTLPATPEFFHRNGANSLRPDCKQCRGRKVKAYYEQPEVHEQRTAYSKDYRQKNATQVKAHKHEYYSRPEVIEHQRERMQAYRERPGKRERKNALAKVYLQQPRAREQHRAYDRVFQHRRRARVKATGGNYTVAQVQDLLKRQKHKCYYCSTAFEKKAGKYVFHVDHVVPLARGGTNDISNVVLACAPCNQHKNARLPHEWPEGGRLL